MEYFDKVYVTDLGLVFFVCGPRHLIYKRQEILVQNYPTMNPCYAGEIALWFIMCLHIWFWVISGKAHKMQISLKHLRPGPHLYSPNTICRGWLGG